MNHNHINFRQKIFDEETILAELNPLLYEEVVTCGIINYIKECDFFRTCREDLQEYEVALSLWKYTAKFTVSKRGLI